jgi:hypothetical protein
VLTPEVREDDFSGYFSIQIDDQVKYLPIRPGWKTISTRCARPSFFSAPLHNSRKDLRQAWKSLGWDGEIHVTTSSEPLPSVETWNPNYVDIISLKSIRTYGGKVMEVLNERESNTSATSPLSAKISPGTSSKRIPAEATRDHKSKLFSSHSDYAERKVMTKRENVGLES